MKIIVFNILILERINIPVLNYILTTLMFLLIVVEYDVIFQYTSNIQ